MRIRESEPTPSSTSWSGVVMLPGHPPGWSAPQELNKYFLLSWSDCETSPLCSYLLEHLFWFGEAVGLTG